MLYEGVGNVSGLKKILSIFLSDLPWMTSLIILTNQRPVFTLRVLPDLLERQVIEDFCGDGSHCGHDLEPGGEIGRVRGEERGQGVAIVRSDQ